MMMYGAIGSRSLNTYSGYDTFGYGSSSRVTLSTLGTDVSGTVRYTSIATVTTARQANYSVTTP